MGLIGHVLTRNLQINLNTVHAYKLCDSQKSQVLHKLDSTYVDSCSPSPCAHIFQHKNLHGNKVHNGVAIFPLFSLLRISNEIRPFLFGHFLFPGILIFKSVFLFSPK